eukprot:gb/GECG01007366.1/.p1 GENE.gb/GECG01007366.1/~~gb/GECG01007366.1/.p1  ORF type:complete len:208 (+),score=4.48 gb/GECG01007366.1/:1-624(+)
MKVKPQRFANNIYETHRIFMATINILFSRDPTKDPITRGTTQRWNGVFLEHNGDHYCLPAGFEIVLTFFNVPDANMLVQPVSFVFIGILVFSNVRGFLTNVYKLFKLYSSEKKSNSITLLVTSIMASYFVSTVLLMRMALPPNYRQAITRAVGDIEFNFFHRWFDAIFIVATVITIIAYILTTNLAGSPEGDSTAFFIRKKPPSKIS